MYIFRLTGWGTRNPPETFGSWVKNYQCFGREDTHLITNSPIVYLWVSIHKGSSLRVSLTQPLLMHSGHFCRPLTEHQSRGLHAFHGLQETGSWISITIPSWGNGSFLSRHLSPHNWSFSCLIKVLWEQNKWECQEVGWGTYIWRHL